MNSKFFTSFPSRRVWLHQHSLVGTHLQLFLSLKTCSTTRHNSHSSNPSRHGGHAWPLFARHNLQFAGSRTCLGTNLVEVRMIPTKKDIAFVEYADETSSAVAKDALHDFKLDGKQKIKVRSLFLFLFTSELLLSAKQSVRHLILQVTFARK
jgi:hypothetical protein